VIDSYSCKFKNCDIDICQNDSAIWIYKGGYNEIEANKIERGNTNNCLGIVIEESKSNIIKNNTFHLNVMTDHFGHIVLKSPIDLNHIIKSDEMDELKIVVDDCAFIWGSRSDELEPTRDDCLMNHQIEINKTELIFG